MPNPLSNSPSKVIFEVDVTSLTRLSRSRGAPIWWGIIGLILIELSVVSAFSVSYFYLQMMNDVWPPQGVKPPNLTIPTANLLLLLTSCGTMYLAGRAVDNDKIKLFVFYTAASVALACTVLWLRWHQFDNFTVSWNEHVYGSLLWTITGFHFLHVVSAAIGTAVIALLGMMGFFTKERQLGVVVDTMYWNFVAVAWIPFYFVLYWAPRILL